MVAASRTDSKSTSKRLISAAMFVDEDLEEDYNTHSGNSYFNLDGLSDSTACPTGEEDDQEFEREGVGTDRCKPILRLAEHLQLN